MNIVQKTYEGLFKALHHPSCGKLIHRSVSAYKSSLSLEKLYPHSSLKLTTPQPPKNDNKFSGYIPVEELEITYSRSSGPGGQNVNKVNTKVDVRFHLESATWLSKDIKLNMSEKFKQKLTKEGYLVFRSDLTRSQQLNLADCLEKIRASVRNSLIVEKEPSPETEEKIRRKLEYAARERLMIKRQKSQIKSDRQGPNIVL